MTSASPPLGRWRRDTPGCEGRIHLNNAGAALMPQPLIDAITGYVVRESQIGGYVAAEESAGKVRENYKCVDGLVMGMAWNITVVEIAIVTYTQVTYDFTLRTD